MDDRRVAVRAVILDKGKLFCVRQRRRYGSISDFWCTPGGGVDPKEPLLDALHREMLEETGVAPVVGKLLFVQQFMHAGREHLELFFHVINSADYRTIELAKTTHGVAEISDYGFMEANDTIMPIFLRTDLPDDPLTVATRFYHYDLDN